MGGWWAKDMCGHRLNQNLSEMEVRGWSLVLGRLMESIFLEVGMRGWAKAGAQGLVCVERKPWKKLWKLLEALKCDGSWEDIATSHLHYWKSFTV